MLQNYLTITIHVRCERAPDTGSLEDLLASSPALRKLIDFISGSATLGRLGAYAGVFELSIGWEGYESLKGANPDVGQIGSRSIGPSVALTTFADANIPEDALTEVIAGICDLLRPWEHPVITITPSRAFVP